MRTARIALLIAIASPWLYAQESESLLESGKRAFEEFYFLEAKAAFAAALRGDPDNGEAAYAHARATLALNEYEEAIASFERALAISPDDPRNHEGYIRALTWGGVLRGRRDWLDRAIEAGGDSLRRFPDLAPLYESIERAIDELRSRSFWLRLLASLEPQIGESPVSGERYLGAKYTAAKSEGDVELAATYEAELRTLLADAAAADPGAIEAGGADEWQAALRRYQLAYGYRLLEDKAREREWLERLDDIERARHLAATWVHFRIYFADFAAARATSAEASLEVIERWAARFPSRWDNPDSDVLRVPLESRLSILREELAQRASDADTTDTGAGAEGALAALTQDELVRQVVALTEQLGRFDTWGGAAHYIFTARELLAADVDPEEVLRLADLFLARLSRGESGLIYPGLAPEMLESEMSNIVAAGQHVRGQALHRMNRIVEAEEALRAAAARSPRSDRFLALGEFLVSQGRESEGYSALVEALAASEADRRIEDPARLREDVLSAARQLGFVDDAVERDLVAATERAEVERRARVVGDRLDAVAPDFDLADLSGTRWRLSDLAGQVVVLNYWATWCGPCRAEFPHYSDLVDEYAGEDDVVFLAITTDTDLSLPRPFLKEHEQDIADSVWASRCGP